jgi:heparosan-N-sulfate-glucuronate 5-epimerase
MSVPRRRTPSPQALRKLADALGSKASALPIGRNIEPDGPRGYYIDFRTKAETPNWPPRWFPWPGYHRFMAIAQWGLGAYEHYLCEGGERWLAAAFEVGEFLVRSQERGGRRSGSWLEPRAHPHTFRVPAPWVSAMAQGECASLLVRLHREAGDERFAESALSGLAPMAVATEEGGVLAQLAGGPFLEEYPTDPPSFVLNGGIFALWGCYDVGLELDDEEARRTFEDGLETLIRNLDRWDAGFWSRYDLYPHPVTNVASPFYHALHIDQLSAMNAIAPNPALEQTIQRFELYRTSVVKKGRALAHKAVFRLLVR